MGEIQTITLTGIKLYETKKDGTPYSFTDKKTGEVKHFKMMEIAFAPDGKTASNGIFSPDDKCLSWKVGDTVSVIFEEKEYKGKIYLNFKLPNQQMKLQDELEALARTVKTDHIQVMLIQGFLDRLERLEAHVYEKPAYQEPNPEDADFPDVEPDEEGIPVSDIPF